MAFPYKEALVIGATSGIGKSLSERLIESGVYVIASGRRRENLEDLVHAYGQEKCSAVQFDITNLKSIRNFAKDITSVHQDLDCVFLNSGIQRGVDFGKPESVDMGAVELELTTNYLSYVTLTKEFLPFLQEKKHQTSLIYTSSGLALVPISRCPNYCASKAALHSFILCLRKQLRETDVKIVEIFPPAVQTELHDEKHQPDLKQMGKIGMPLKEFTDEAWAGLIAGHDQIAVGMAEMAFSAFERQRQEVINKFP